MDALQGMLAHALPWLHRYGYAAVAAAIVIEGIGVPAPGQTLLIGASLLAGRGEMNLTWVLVCALSATVVGNNLGYFVGRNGGRRLVLRLGVNRKRLMKLSRFYRRYGAWPVLFSRFVEGARQLGSMLAGTGAMPWGRFFACDFCGALMWVGTWGAGPYLMAANAERLQQFWHRIDPLALVIVLSILVVLALWLWRPGRTPPPS